MNSLGPQLAFSADISEASMGLLLDDVDDAVQVVQESGLSSLTIYVSSCGGDTTAAFMAYDRLRRLQELTSLEVTTIATGYCLSAGIILLQAGKVRLATPHTAFLMHTPFQMPWGVDEIKPDEIDARYQLQNLTVDIMSNLLADRTGMTLTDWRAILRNPASHYFGPDKAKWQYHIIDEIT